jgi:hypothetical protein
MYLKMLKNILRERISDNLVKETKQSYENSGHLLKTNLIFLIILFLLLIGFQFFFKCLETDIK